MTITLYDCGIPYGNFIKENGLGYITENSHKQYRIIKSLIQNPNKLEVMKKNIRSLNLQFSSDEAAKIISQNLLPNKGY